MVHRRDYYEVLGVQRDSDPADIKKAYRQAAMKFHPDRNPGDKVAEESFKEASEAYEVLSDSQKRQLYDAYGHSGLENSGYHGFEGGVDDVFSSFGDLFSEIFGFEGFAGQQRGRGRSRSRQGADLRYDLVIDFKDCIHGIEKEIEVSKQETCEVCKGKGVKPGTDKEDCKTCNGSGQITQRQGFFMLQTTCPRCHGTGEHIPHPCEECRGHGQVLKKKKLTIKIPAGVDDGMKLVMRGEGEPGSKGAPHGDLYVFIGVHGDDFFKRHNDDVYCQIPISFPQAALGTHLTIPTLYGNQEVEIPAGIETGERIKVKGMGFPNIHSKKKGDQIVEIVVKTPKKLTKNQKHLLEEFMKEKS